MAEQIKTEWTDDQVKSANEYQASGVMHPFTCSNCRADLTATKQGWVCDVCNKHIPQNWAWDWMLNWKWKEFSLGFLSIDADRNNNGQ